MDLAPPQLGIQVVGMGLLHVGRRRFRLPSSPRFVNRRALPRVLRTGDTGRVGRVFRQDLARVLLDAAERPDYIHQAIVVGS